MQLQLVLMLHAIALSRHLASRADWEEIATAHAAQVEAMTEEAEGELSWAVHSPCQERDEG